MNVGWFERGVLLDDFLNAHTVAIAGQNRGYPNACSGYHRLPATASGVFLNVPTSSLGIKG